jgi:predicted dehydrogenase
MDTIAIIGAGGIGERHLQAVGNIDRPVRIQVMDISVEALKKAKDLYAQVSGNNIRSIEFIKDLSDLYTEIDVAVIATSSKPRAQIIKSLLETKKVKNMILEKVLFPRLEEYDNIGMLLEQYGCKAWVNCTRRTWPSYRKIKDIIKGQQFKYTVSGSNWGLTCNSIHFIDTIAFLSGSSDGFMFDTSKLDSAYIDSKRDGYIELTGELTGYSNVCESLSFTSFNKGKEPLISEIVGENTQIRIDEGACKATVSHKKNNWHTEEIDFDVIYQSQQTDKDIIGILDKGECMLPTYNESVKLHKPLLSAFMCYLSKAKGEVINECPIT